MCRNIRTLANYHPPATDDEIRDSALQFVRKLSGTTRPSKVNEVVFNRAVDEVTLTAQRLIRSLQTKAPPRDRDVERGKAMARSRKRFGKQPRHSPIPSSAEVSGSTATATARRVRARNAALDPDG